MRSSLLIDLSQGKRIEVEQLQGSVVRRAARAGRAGADYVDAVRGAEAVGGRRRHPNPREQRVEARVPAQRRQRGIDGEEDGAPMLAVDERREVRHGLVESAEAAPARTRSCSESAAAPSARRDRAAASRSCPIRRARPRYAQAASSAWPSSGTPKQT